MDFKIIWVPSPIKPYSLKEVLTEVLEEYTTMLKSDSKIVINLNDKTTLNEKKRAYTFYYKKNKKKSLFIEIPNNYN